MSEIANIAERLEKVRIIAPASQIPIYLQQQHDIRFLLAKIADLEGEILALRGPSAA